MDDLRPRGEILVLADLGLDLPFVAVKSELERGIDAQRPRRAGDHRRRSRVASHGVYGDARAVSHSLYRLVSAPEAQASLETTSRPL